MKKFNNFMILALLVSSLSAHAGIPGFKPAPEACWTNLDGRFIVTLEVDGLTGVQAAEGLEEILRVRQELGDQAPLILQSGGGAITVRIAPRKKDDESKRQLIERSNRELHDLMDKTGALVQCAPIRLIRGGVSGSN